MTPKDVEEAHYQELLRLQRDAHQSLRAAQRRADNVDFCVESSRGRLDAYTKEERRVSRSKAV